MVNFAENSISVIRSHLFISAVSVTALAYSDALARVGSMAKMCKGGTEDIGKAYST